MNPPKILILLTLIYIVYPFMFGAQPFTRYRSNYMISMDGWTELIALAWNRKTLQLKLSLEMNNQIKSVQFPIDKIVHQFYIILKQEYKHLSNRMFENNYKLQIRIFLYIFSIQIRFLKRIKILFYGL